MTYKDFFIRILSLLPKLIVCLSLSLASPLKAEDKRAVDPDQKLLDDIRSRFFRDNQLLQKYFQDGFLERMDRLMEDNQMMNDEVFKEMQKAFEQDPFFDGQNFAGKWEKSKEGMTYLIDAEVSEGGKFDVKVKDGQVSLEADVVRKLGQFGTHKTVMKRSFPVPEGCDGDQVKVEAREGKMAILFPWKEEKGSDKGSSKKPDKKQKPLLKSPGDVTI